jgi:O-methyltransferase involved in polyketide biosynthesis
MASIGAKPTAQRRAVSIDLRDDWPAELRRNGFDDTKPAAWSAEGLLVYLPPEAQDRLFDNIATLSAPGSRLATEYHPDAGASMGRRAEEFRQRWQKHGFDMNLADLFYPGERNPVVEYLTEHGWQVTARNRTEMFTEYGRHFPDSEELAPMRDSLAVTAIRHKEFSWHAQTTTAGTWPRAWEPPRPRSRRPVLSPPRAPTRSSTTRSPSHWCARSASTNS